MEEYDDVSQFGEYTFLKEHFRKYPPKYKCLVDVGAKNISLSNSYNFLVDYDWKGLLVEPNGRNFEALSKVYLVTPNVILVKAAISDYDGHGKFYIHQVEGHHSLVNKSDRYVMSDVFRLPTVLKRQFIPLNFDYLTIDAEGVDHTIVKDMLDNSDYRPTVIVHEKNNGKGFEDKLLEKHKYKIIYETEGNFIYRRKR